MTKLTQEQSEEARHLAMWVIGELTHKANNRTLEIPQAQLLARAYLASLDRDGVVVPREQIIEECAKIALTAPRKDSIEWPVGWPRGVGDLAYAYATGGNDMAQAIFQEIRALAAAPQPVEDKS